MRRAIAGLALTASLLVGGASPAHASHRGDRCRYEDCDSGRRYGDGGSGGGQGASGGDYEGGKSGDNDQRGDHNCRNFCFYGIPQPGGGDQPPSKGQQPKQLFPPTPQGIRDFVVATIKGGIEMGKVFSETVITFVENLTLGLA